MVHAVQIIDGGNLDVTVNVFWDSVTDRQVQQQLGIDLAALTRVS